MSIQKNSNPANDGKFYRIVLISGLYLLQKHSKEKGGWNTIGRTRDGFLVTQWKVKYWIKKVNKYNADN